MDSVKKEFSRNARFYNRYNQIQKSVVTDLLAQVTDRPRRIVDLGSGSGEVYTQISWPVESFTAVDFSEAMCRLHPLDKEVTVLRGDFNEDAIFSTLSTISFERLFSASALQWAHDIHSVFLQIARLQKPIALALFTSNTFASLHHALGVSSPLPTKEKIEDEAKRHFKADISVKRYELAFESTRMMFDYIKKSGVSSGMKQLGVGELRQLIRENRLRKIEAEVVFIVN